MELELGLACGEARVVGAWRSVYTVHTDTVHMVHIGMGMGTDMGMNMGMNMGVHMASGML